MTQEKEPVYGDKIAIERNKRAYLFSDRKQAQNIYKTNYFEDKTAHKAVV